MGESEIFADTMVRMDDEVAFFELSQTAHQLAGTLLPGFSLPVAAFAEDLLFADEQQFLFRQRESAGKLTDTQLRVTGGQVIQAQGRVDVQLDRMSSEQLLQPFGLAALVTDQQDAPVIVCCLLQSPDQRFEAVMLLVRMGAQFSVADAVEVEALPFVIQLKNP